MGLNSGGCFLVKSTEANMMEVRERLSDEETGAGGPEERVLGGGRRGQGSELTEDGGKGLQREGAQHKPRELGIGRDQTNSKDRATVRKTEVSARTRGPVLRCHWGLLTGELLLPLSPSPHHISSTEESGPFQLGARRCQGHGGLSGQAAPPPLPLRDPQAAPPPLPPQLCRLCFPTSCLHCSSQLPHTLLTSSPWRTRAAASETSGLSPSLFCCSPLSPPTSSHIPVSPLT